MDHQLRADVLQRLEADYGLRHMSGTNYMRKGKCPSCSKPTLYARHDEPWFIKCGREQKCGQLWHVKELYDDLFQDWSKRFPHTDQQPTATARAYLSFNRGFHLELIEGFFSQEHYHDTELNIGSATVRFALEHGGYWERLIDRPGRFGKKKARFQPRQSYRGWWWAAPSVDLINAREIWVVEGIFDAIALMHHGIAAVAALSSNAFPDQSMAELGRMRGGKLPKLVWALDNEPGAHAYTRRWVKQAREMGFACEAAQIPQADRRKVDWNDLHQRWMALEDDDVRAKRIEKDLDEARHPTHCRKRVGKGAADVSVEGARRVSLRLRLPDVLVEARPREIQQGRGRARGQRERGS